LILLLLIDIRKVLWIQDSSRTSSTARPDIGIGSSIGIELVTSRMLVITEVESLLLKGASTRET
jgi:hypothetical protein